jgi:hypothetical protein
MIGLAKTKLGSRKIREERHSLNGSMEMTASHFILSIDVGVYVNSFKSW